MYEDYLDWLDETNRSNEILEKVGGSMGLMRLIKKMKNIKALEKMSPKELDVLQAKFEYKIKNESKRRVASGLKERAKIRRVYGRRNL